MGNEDIELWNCDFDYEETYTEEDYVVVPGTGPNGEDVYLRARYAYIEDDESEVVWEENSP